MKLILIALTAVIAGLIQGVAGFGSGPVQMMMYPHLWPISSAAAVSVGVSVPVNINMVLTYRRHIDWKKVLVPIIPYMLICSVAIGYSSYFDQILMKKIFGIFLIALAIYNLFAKQQSVRMTPVRTACYILFSALCDAFFGIGGPLMVLYFLAKTDNQKEYLGTVSAFFLLNGLWNTGVRIATGILTVEFIPALAVGIVSILAGVTIAHRLVSHMDEKRLKRVTYFMIGTSGILNFIG